MPPPDQLANLASKVDTLERDVVQIKSQFPLYEPIRENELKLNYMNDSITRIFTELGKVKDSLEALSKQLITLEADARKRDSEIREGMASLYNKILLGLVSAAGTVLIALLVNYLIHGTH